MPEDYFPGLRTLIADAVKQSPRMIARTLDEALAESTRISNRSGQLPSVGGYGTYYPLDEQIRDYGGGSTPTHVQKIGFGMSITQPLFHWGALRATTKTGDMQLRLTQGQTAEAYRTLVYEIRATYLQLVMRKAGVKRATLNQRIADAQLALARSKREKGVISDADLFSPTIAAESARLAYDKAVDAYEVTRRSLSKLTGAPPLADDAVGDAIPAVTPDSGLRQLVDDFTGRPDPDTYQLRSTRRQIEMEHLTYDVIKTRLWPKFNMIAGISQDQQKLSVTGGVPYMVRDYFIGGQVTWSVFDGFATKAAKSASLTRRRQLEQTFRDQTADLIEGVKDRARQIDFAGRSLAMSEKLLNSAENLYRAAKEDLERGNTSEAAVNSAELNLIDSQIGSYGARYDYMIRVADLVSVIMHDPALANLPAKYR